MKLLFILFSLIVLSLSGCTIISSQTPTKTYDLVVTGTLISVETGETITTLRFANETYYHVTANSSTSNETINYFIGRSFGNVCTYYLQFVEYDGYYRAIYQIIDIKYGYTGHSNVKGEQCR